MVTCCGVFKKFSKRKNPKKRRKAAALRVPAEAVTSTVGEDCLPVASNLDPVVSMTQNDLAPVRRAISSLISSEGEFFDCRSDMSGSAFDRSPGFGLSVACEDTEMGIHEQESAETDRCPTCGRSDNGMDYGASLWVPRNSTALSEAPLEDNMHNSPFEHSMTKAEDSGASLTSSERIHNQPTTALAACLSLIHGRSLETPENRKPKNQYKPRAGASLKRLSKSDAMDVPVERWEPVDPCSFTVRSEQYMKTKLKTNCEGSFYETIDADVFSFDEKSYHIAKRVVLPSDPYSRTEAQKFALAEWGIPTFLVINMQVPMYPASLFGATDGPGHSLVYYCVLREGFNPDKEENQGAVQLLQRLIQNGREQNSDPSRNRLKIIPRVVNVEEWSAEAPLSKAENKLLTAYNEKPILSKPQHAFFSGPNYFEIDFDIHSYTFIARKAFGSMFSRLNSVVFDNAIVMQGNRPEELPEYLLSCVRVHRVDFMQMRYMSEIAKAQAVDSA